MRGRFGWLAVAIVAVVAILFYFSVFVVSQTQQALVLRFGQVVAPLGFPLAPVIEPGLYYKLPLIDNVVYFDKRLLDLDSPPLEIIASDQKRLVVDAFGRYRIVDPLRFYQSLGTPADRAAAAVGCAQLGGAPGARRREFHRPGARPAGGADGAHHRSRSTARPRRLGVEVVDVRIRSADLPDANSQAIYQRMQTERQLVAAQTRAQGEQASRQIRAEADRQATVIVAEANGESAQLRGDGEAQRNQILADSVQPGPRLLRLLPVAAGLPAGLALGRHAAGASRPTRISSATSTICTEA